VDELDQSIEAGRIALATHAIVERQIHNELRTIAEPITEKQPQQQPQDAIELFNLTR
jgi:hypothetical protein